jgi:hypothetical protein
VDVSRVRFIPPAFATLRASPPIGEQWQYEVKFDGFRAQLHIADQAATIYGKNGGDLTRRFPTIAEAILALPTRSCIIDGELIAAGAEGQPDFLALLHGRHVPVCVYAFDLMELDRRDLRDQPLEQLRRGHPWTWVVCERCLRRWPVAWVPLIITWGADASRDLLRRSARCGKCGRKGAALQHPSWGGSHIGWEPFPV